MLLLILEGSRADRLRAAALRERDLRPAARLHLDPAQLPFVPAAPAALPIAQPRLVRIDDLERAFPNRQASGTRLVLTQSTYLLQTWIDQLGAADVVIATADRDELRRNAPEAFNRRGPWRLFETVSADHTAREQAEADEPARTVSTVVDLLVRAFHSPSLAERVALCRGAADADPCSPVAALALASALAEARDMAAAREALERALGLAPEWAAAHYEDGKYWLAMEDMERARDGFERAADLMPTFSAAWSNLGATLGELDDAEGAARAFARALEHDPESFTILNNIGVVNREIGRLEESEAALERVVRIAPDFVFGHYNLGHTRFLRGDYAGALAAYEEGQRLDPEKNRRQGCRLAVVRLANGDVAGAERDLWYFADAAPPDEREDLLLEAYEIALALMKAHPGLARDQTFVDRIAAALTL